MRLNRRAALALTAIALLVWGMWAQGLALAAPYYSFRVVYTFKGLRLQPRGYYYYWELQPAPKPSAQPLPQLVPKELTQDEALMLQLVNKERLQAGLQPLSVDSRLVELARKKSKDMVDVGYFAHYSPTYGSPFDMMRAAGVNYRTAGENIAGAPTVETAHRALMNSPGHRANILNPAFTHIGIGIVDGGPYGKMFTQMFIGT